MDVKTYTDIKYVPISDLRSLGKDFLDEIRKYRMSFTEMIQISEFKFASIVETPKLLKKRYSKNVEIKDKLDIQAKDNDFILELAKEIIKKNKKYKIDQENYKKIIEKYKNNNNDLTIITNWIIRNINLFTKEKEKEFYLYPKLNKNDLNFINKCNNKNNYYTIQKYNEINATSYETGRKSLEKMVKEGFYSKEKIARKFIYRPTKKINTIKKESQNES